MKIIGIKGVQELLSCSEEMAKKILNAKGSPAFKRGKGQHYKVFDEELMEWLREGGYRGQGAR